MEKHYYLLIVIIHLECKTSLLKENNSDHCFTFMLCTLRCRCLRIFVKDTHLRNKLNLLLLILSFHHNTKIKDTSNLKSCSKYSTL